MAKRLTASERAKLRTKFIQGASLKENKKAPPKTAAKSLIYLRVSEGLKQAIGEICDDTGKSENTVCIELLEEGVERRLF